MHRIKSRSWLLTLGVSAARAGAVDLAVLVYDDEGSALRAARVAISWEMPGRSGSRSEAPAVETAPGHYQVADAVLDMPGEWRVTARVLPRGQPTRIASFTVEKR